MYNYYKFNEKCNCNHFQSVNRLLFDLSHFCNSQYQFLSTAKELRKLKVESLFMKTSNLQYQKRENKNKADY